MPSAPAHVLNVPVNQIREITQAAWATPDAIVLSIGEPGFPVARHVLEAGMAALDRDDTNYTPNAGIAPARRRHTELPPPGRRLRLDAVTGLRRR